MNVIPLLTLSRYDFQDHVKLVDVDRKEAPFVVHKRILEEKAPGFFNRLTPEQDQSNQTAPTYMLDIDSCAINLYLRWLYTSDRDVELFIIARDVPRPELIQTLIKLWTFAEWILDFECCNKICDSIMRMVTERDHSVRHGLEVFQVEDTRRSSMLRKLFIDLRLDMAAEVAQGIGLTSKVNGLPFECIEDLAGRYLRNESCTDVFEGLADGGKRAGCRYHLHPDGQRCDGSEE
jgi:hypothetical protein